MAPEELQSNPASIDCLSDRAQENSSADDLVEEGGLLELDGESLLSSTRNMTPGSVLDDGDRTTPFPDLVPPSALSSAQTTPELETPREPYAVLIPPPSLAGFAGHQDASAPTEISVKTEGKSPVVHFPPLPELGGVQEFQLPRDILGHKFPVPAVPSPPQLDSANLAGSHFGASPPRIVVREVKRRNPETKTFTPPSEATRLEGLREDSSPKALTKEKGKTPLSRPHNAHLTQQASSLFIPTNPGPSGSTFHTTSRAIPSASSIHTDASASRPLKRELEEPEAGGSRPVKRTRKAPIHQQVECEWPTCSRGERYFDRQTMLRHVETQHLHKNPHCPGGCRVEPYSRRDALIRHVKTRGPASECWRQALAEGWVEFTDKNGKPSIRKPVVSSRRRRT